MILDMLRVRDFGVQYACTRALLHLIRHNGEVDWDAYFAKSSLRLVDLFFFFPPVYRPKKPYQH